jgi:alpha-beta hydrolase superfamily lysophospholipase
MSRKTKKRSVLKTILIILLLVLLASFITGYIITASQMKKFFPRYEKIAPEFNAGYQYDHYEAEYPRQEVSFRSGDNVLKGYIYGLNNDKGVIVFAHGLGGAHDDRYLPLITALVDRGWRIFAYDATGSGTSEGKGTIGLAQSDIDLDRALNYVENNSVFANMPIFVMGHSWGGYASAAVLNFDHKVKASVSMSGYNSPMSMLCEQVDEMYGDKSFLVYPFLWTYNKIHAGRYASLTAVDGINKSNIPVLIIHGDNDEVIKYYGSSIISQQGRIKNRNAEYYTFETEGKDSHNGYFCTSDYHEYFKTELKEKYDEAANANNNDEWAKYIASVDKEKYSTVNPDLVDMIDDFFIKQLNGADESTDEEAAAATETTTAETAEATTSEETSSENEGNEE